MILALDIGNGSVKYAVFREGRRAESGRLPLDADFAQALPRDAGKAAAVSVNPPALARLRAGIPGLLVVGEDLPPAIPIRYHPPESLGLDRVMSVVGALHHENDAESVAVLDAGTCLTMTVGSRREGVLGGAILPGIELWARALREGTAQLPLVDPRPPDRAVGRSTEESIRSGIGHGFLGAARELIRATLAEVPGARVVAAGTGGSALAARLPEIRAIHPFATLWGVYLTAAAG